MRTRPIKIMTAYVAICISWILASDHLILGLSDRWQTYELLNTGKGIVFVFVTGGLLYYFSKMQQNCLLRSEDQYKRLFHSNPSPLWVYDIETLNFLEVNDAAIAQYGYSREDFKRMTVCDIHHAVRENAGSSGSMGDTSYVTGKWKHRKKNGKFMLVSVKAHEINFNERPAIMVMSQDITVKILQERKLRHVYEVEKDLRRALEEQIVLVEDSLKEKARLAEVIDRVNNIVIITDNKGVITWVNNAFVNHTGYNEEEVIGRTTSFLHGPETDPETQQKIMDGIAKNDFSSYEILNYTKSGQPYWVELSISAVYDCENKIERFISIQTIINERKRREEQIKEQNKILRQLAWTNSHSLRKPVASIMSLLMLSKVAERKEEIDEIHSLMENCTTELDGIIKEIGQNINQNEIGL